MKGDTKKRIISYNNEEISKWDYETTLANTKIIQNLARLQVANLNRYLSSTKNIRPNIIRENNESLDRKRSIDKVNYIEHKFALKGDETINQLKHEFYVARHFLIAKTSKIGKYKKGEVYEGFKGIIGKFAERLDINIKDLSKDKFDLLWEIFNKIDKLNNAGKLDKSRNYSSNQLQKEIYDIIDSNNALNKEEILEQVIKKLSDVKEKEQEEDEQISTTLTFGIDTGRKD